jgi:pectin methylesterase-like acyl-CoA thioesterase
MLQRSISTLGLALALAGAASAATYVILPDGSGDYATIQAAIDAAAPGDVIELADGIFSGPGNPA